MATDRVPAVPGITEQRLAEIEALVNAATEGPWWAEHVKTGRDSTECEVHVLGVDLCDLSIPVHMDDAVFIAACRTAVPELLAEVRRLNGQVEQVKAHVGAAITAGPASDEFCDLCDEGRGEHRARCPWAALIDTYAILEARRG